MGVYKIALTRAYLVAVKAENQERAKRLIEFYLGDCPDLSNENQRHEEKFSIVDVEMVYNNADEIVEVIEE